MEQVMDKVLQRLNAGGPAALLIGDRPPDLLGYRIAAGAPYEAVIIGSLTAGELLRFSDDRVWDALLAGMPVFLYEGGLRYRACASTANRALWSRLLSAERWLRQLGVRFYGDSQARRLVTAAQARQLLAQGCPPPAGAVLTPLAREILEGGRRS